ncbi:YybH family protein [Micromonospora sp. URMC 105]|uniref:YybH family protein n=1 Tax=Micromonospora sp. URMC 105 TaxID=3423413 RepID=UPI003F1DB582
MTAISGESLLTDDANKHVEHYAQAFNSGDPELLDRMYTEDAVAVWGPNEPLTGQARREYVAEFLARRPVMTVQTRHSYVTGDTALMVVDWSIDMTGENGEPEHHEGVGLDVLRRGADGMWRHAIDDPYGDVS